MNTHYPFYQVFLAATLLTGSPLVTASGTITGSLTNFDVTNTTGGETHGFEIEIHGIDRSDVIGTFGGNHIRYGDPTVNRISGGVSIRYESPWDATAGKFLQATPVVAPGFIPNSHSCWTGGLGNNYAASGCEHFGVSLRKQPTSTQYRWLVGDPAKGTLTPVGAGSIPLPAPRWNAAQRNPEAPVVVQAEIEIPNPEGRQYGDAYWVKIFKTEIEQAVELDQLLFDNPVLDNEVTEIEWEMLQKKPGQALVLNEAPLGQGKDAVIRRFEFYHYNKAWGLANQFDDNGKPTYYVDHVNGEVQACVIDGCNNPTANELGDYIGRQIAGVNLQVVPLPPALMLFFSSMMLILLPRHKTH